LEPSRTLRPAAAPYSRVEKSVTGLAEEGPAFARSDVASGATPIAFGNWERAYTVVE
jgi:hypothetical protein